MTKNTVNSREMATYSAGNPGGAYKDFKEMTSRAEESLNSLPSVMKSQVGGYLFGDKFGEEFTNQMNKSDTTSQTGNIVTNFNKNTLGPAFRPPNRTRGGRRRKTSRHKLEKMTNNTRRNRNRKQGGYLFGSPESMTSSTEGFRTQSGIQPAIPRPSQTSRPQNGGRRTMRQGKGSAGSWAKAVTKYYKDQKRTRKALKFSQALKEAAKLKKAGKLMY